MNTRNTSRVRLFVAVDPSEEVVDLLEALPRPGLMQLRWTTPPQWHVTLRFLGEVADDQVPALAGALDSLAGWYGEPGEPVQALLGPAVAWFTGRRVLQVPVDGLDLLAAQVAGATVPWGDPADHPFRGHVTLARVRGPKPGPPSLAGGPLHAEWPVTQVVLYHSRLGEGGARYDAVHRVALPAP